MSYEPLPPEVLRAHKGKSFVGVSVVFFCHDGAGKLFFAKRSEKARDEAGRWDVGAGGLKWGERAEDTVKRELMEEFGAEPLEIEFLGYRDAFRQSVDGTPTHWLGLDFLVRVDPAQVRLMEPDMADSFGWFEFHELPDPLHSQIPIALEQYGKRIQETIAQGRTTS
jgi:ADP-ribose pyrophosphatase YjhB (NUDIX family)